VLVASSTPKKARLLPRGPFREPFRSLSRAGVVVLTQKGRGDHTLEVEGEIDPYLRESPVRVAFVPAGWTDLSGRPSTPPEGGYLAVAGIGDPGGFDRVLAEAVESPGEVVHFPDHHAYRWGDIQTILDRAQGRPILTTEKDAVKLEAFHSHLQDVRVLRLGVEVLDGEERLWRHVEGVLRVGASGRRGTE